MSKELPLDSGRAEILVVGGAAMVLPFQARETTKDVDAVFLSPDPSGLRSAVARVAASLDLPDDWLNDGAKGYVVGLTTGEVLYESERLLVRAPSTPQLLAMKLAAWRDVIDREDAKLLLTEMAGSVDEVWAALEPHIPPPQNDKAWYAFQDLWEVVHGPS